MKYVNAKAVLPEKLVKELQGYIQGGYLYVPADPGRQKKGWGELTGYRRELQLRNQKIIDAYRGGWSAEELAEEYNLSVHAIRKIIYGA